MPKTSSKNILFVISAPSGAGKTTLWKKLISELKDIRRSISVTTRQPRKGEKNGRDYHFVSEEDFKRMIENDELIEWAEVHGHYYGTLRKNIEKAQKEGYDLILEIDVQGGMNIKKTGLDAVFIFILPPSFEELKRRLKKRKDLKENEIEKRLKNAEEEMKYVSEYDYCIINDRLERAYNELKSIVIAERLKVKRNEGLIKEFHKNR